MISPRPARTRLKDLRRVYERSHDDPRKLASLLGVRPAGGAVEFAFWLPQHSVGSGPPVLEILRPLNAAKSWFEKGRFRVHRFLFELEGTGPFWWGVLEGLDIGGRKGWGDFYRLHLPKPKGGWQGTGDPFAVSLPFGSFGPAEIYSLAECQADRADLSYLRRRSRQERPPRPSAVLEIHTQTATSGGTLASLREWIESGRGSSLKSPDQAESILHDFDAIQLLPLEPAAEPARLATPWNQAPCAGRFSFEVSRPHILNWGYDTLIAGFSGTNPGLLESARPHEVVDLIAALHTLPGGGMQVFLDLVLGHAHRQAARLLPSHYFAGPNRYGLNLNYSLPMVRAILLELVGRKLTLGADGIRFDATQDIQTVDPTTGARRNDDEFLRELGELEADVAGIPIKPLRIFEDTRPWPARGWRKRATFDDGLRNESADLQWGPLCFPDFSGDLEKCRKSRRQALLTTLHKGSKWISGGSTHDTFREECRLWGLRPDESETLSRRKLFDPVSALLLYTALPGIPLEFLNALFERPWAFLRNAGRPEEGRDILAEWGFVEQCLEGLGYWQHDSFQEFRDQGIESARSLRSRILKPAKGRASPKRSFDGNGGEPIETMWGRAIQKLGLVEGATLPSPASRWLISLGGIRRRRKWLAEPLSSCDRHWQATSGSDGILVRAALGVLRVAPKREESLVSLGVWGGEPVRIRDCMKHLGVDSKLDWKVLASTPGLSLKARMLDQELAGNQALCLSVASPEEAHE